MASGASAARKPLAELAEDEFLADLVRDTPDDDPARVAA